MCTARARERGWRAARSLSKRQALTRECACTRFVPWQAELSHAESEQKEANENELPEWDLQLKVNEKKKDLEAAVKKFAEANKAKREQKAAERQNRDGGKGEGGKGGGRGEGGGRGKGGGKGGKGKGKGGGKSAPKSMEDLDAELDSYKAAAE